MVERFLKPRDAGEAISLLALHPGSVPIAGGTFLLSPQWKERRMTVVSVQGVLPKGIKAEGDTLEIGANATFQDILDSPSSPGALKDAARGMADRNIRNRATVGGNAGAAKSCSSLAPLFLACDAVFALYEGPFVNAGDWFARPSGLVESVSARFPAERRFAYRRWSRTACDVSVLGACAAYELSGGALRNVRIALGGMGPKPRRFGELESLFEGGALPSRDEIEAMALPFLLAADDVRGSGAFKNAVAAALLSDCLTGAVARDGEALS